MALNRAQPPAKGEPTTAATLTQLSLDGRAIMQRIDEFNTTAIHERLGSILDFLARNVVQLVVFPECSVPIGSMPLLLQYSGAITIVAGVGYVRNESESTRLLEHCKQPQSKSLIQKNVAVLVHNGQVELITKKHLAESEQSSAGAGPRYFDLQIGERDIRVAVAICKDAVSEVQTIRNMRPDLLCVPLWTATTDPFVPDAPRDYLHLLANTAQHGGSMIAAPSMLGPFVSKRGTDPLPRGVEGIVAIDFLKYATKPTSLEATENRTVIRAEIVAPDDANMRSIVEGLQKMSAESSFSTQTMSSDTLAQLARYKTHIKTSGPLNDAVGALQQTVMVEREDKQLSAVCTNHLVALGESQPAHVRSRQASYMRDRLLDLIRYSAGAEGGGLGALLDAYTGLSRQFAPEPNWSDVDHNAEWWTREFLISPDYDRGAASLTLPRQLAFISAMAEMNPGCVRLTYRLVTESVPESETVLTRFIVSLSGRQGVVDEVSITRQLRSLLLQSWSIHVDPQVPSPGDYHLRFQIESGQTIPLAPPDWAPIADLLRSHNSPISLEMTATPAPSESDSRVRSGEQFDQLLEKQIRIVQAIPSTQTNSLERDAIAFYALSDVEAPTRLGSLELRFSLRSESPVPQFFVHHLVTTLFGALKVRQLGSGQSTEDGLVLDPREAIRYFHLPYGRIRGRAEPTSDERFPQLTPVPAEFLTKVGSVLGTSLVLGEVTDEFREVRLDDDALSRHLYIVGKTGTGKTNLLKEICRQEINIPNRCVVVLDPHGDLVDYLAARIEGREEDTILLDFGDPEYTALFNPLAVDVNELTRELHVSDFLHILQRRHNADFSGPRWNDIVRMVLETMFLRNAFPLKPSIGYVETLLQSQRARNHVMDILPDGSLLRDRWSNFEDQNRGDRAEVISWVLSKFAELLPLETPLRAALCSTIPTPLTFDRVVAEGKVLLVRMPETVLGRDATSFTGQLILHRIQRAIFAHSQSAWRNEVVPRHVMLCLDEFQKFVDSGIETFLAEGRKFACGLILAHQNLDQLEQFTRYEHAHNNQLLAAVLGNVGSAVSFRVGPRDRPRIAELLRAGPERLKELARFDCLARISYGGDESPVFTLRVPKAERVRESPTAYSALRARMIEQGYWVRRERVSAEVREQPAELYETLSLASQKALADQARRKAEANKVAAEQLNRSSSSRVASDIAGGAPVGRGRPSRWATEPWSSSGDSTRAASES